MKARFFAIGLVLVTLLASLILFTGSERLAYAQGIDDDNRDNDPHATGLIMMTPGEEAAFRMTHGRVIKVLPNKIALGRINNERAKKGLPLLPETAAAPLGKEIISSKGGSAAGVADITFEPLATSADNSILPAFPEIRSQGSLGSCTAFATVYYQHTYMVGFMYNNDANPSNDWNNKDTNNATKFSPK